MKSLSKGIVLSALSLTSLFNVASAYETSDVDYYFGLDVNYVNTPLESTWVNTFRQNKAGATVYWGMRPHENIGLELGYLWTTRKSKNLVVANGATYLGITSNAGADRTVSSRSRLVSTKLDVVFYLPVHESFEFTLNAGYGWSRIKPEFTISTTGSNLDGLTSISDKTRGHLRAGLGFQSLITDKLGIRVRADYADIGRVKVKGAASGVDPKVFKAAYSVGLGMYYYF